MPENIVKSFAKKSGKSEDEVKKLEDKFIKQAEEQFKKKKDKFGDKEWEYVTGTLKKALKIKEANEDVAREFLKSELPIDEFYENVIKST